MRAEVTRDWQGLAAVTAIVVASVVCAPDAIAQKNPGPPNALQGFSRNRNEPMKIRAASLEVRQKDKMATFTGDVYVLQGDTEMRCKQLVVFYEEETGTRTTDAAAPGAGGDRQIRLIEGHLEKFFSPSRCESDSLTAMGHGRMERASHGADGLFRC